MPYCADPECLGVFLPSPQSITSCFATIERLGLSAVQICTRSNNRWSSIALSPDIVFGAREKSKHYPPGLLLTQASQLINISSPDEDLRVRSRDALVDELRRAEALGFSWVVLNPGSHDGSGEEAGSHRAIQTLNEVLDRTKAFGVGILLKNNVHKEGRMCHRFEQLSRIRKRIRQHFRIGVCLDICNAFAVGYDMRGEDAYQHTVTELDREVGIKNVKALHLADSLAPLGSQLCVPTAVGTGSIGLDVFASCMRDRRWQGIPKILMTPRSNSLDSERRDLQLLRQLARPGSASHPGEGS